MSACAAAPSGTDTRQLHAQRNAHTHTRSLFLSSIRYAAGDARNRASIFAIFFGRSRFGMMTRALSLLLSCGITKWREGILWLAASGLTECLSLSSRRRRRVCARAAVASSSAPLSLDDDDGQLETLSDSLMTHFFTLLLMMREAYSRVLGSGMRERGGVEE